ncbi:hypothetical protein [Aliikangiella sp. G2MR2-5]|uniref:hypothetical protein n=1 Tax=Aliikangiella sp. G2MR2-5 TaxID=2788943 RepID=UPI0018AAA48E|nr:hypothetical protein [Aliikangiella sp. G2MR2-5]
MIDIGGTEWVSEDPEFYADLLSRKDRKLKIILKQLKSDFSSIKIVLGFLIVGFLIGAGITQNELKLGVIGIGLLGVYLYIFIKNIVAYIYSPIFEGELIAGYESKSKWPGFIHSEAFFNNVGEKIPIAISKKLFNDVVSKRSNTKIKILYTPSFEYSLVIAAKKERLDTPI